MIKIIYFHVWFLFFTIQLNAFSTFISPDPTVVDTTGEFEININVDEESTEFRGYKLIFSYNDSIMEFVSAEKGPLMLGFPNYWWRVVEESSDTVRIECIIMGAGLYVNGPGTILVLTFNALVEEITELNFVYQEFYYAFGGGIIPDVSTDDGTIIIGGVPAYANIKAWLEGAYDATGDSMRTFLNNNIPLTSPYSEDPVTVEGVPGDVVDWVLVELRTTATASSFRKKSMFLKSNGKIMTPCGGLAVFLNTDPGNYYVVIRHRNHLSIMSSSAYEFKEEGTAIQIDLTTESAVYGTGGVIELEVGVYGMIAGDANQDGWIFPDDRNDYWRVQSGQSGYKSADFNLDGNVFPDDMNDYWRHNSGKGSTVP
ncbi:MAG: hypothetical protein KAW92_13645 [Candidatus Cloacimonetes bacterium]|nr:hypothetical protein [Candidatus Cloacimonadota bacterium]